MEHIKEIDLQRYKNSLFDEEENTVIENHLYCCDICMDKYLSLVSSEEMDTAKSFLSPEFTERVVWNVEKEIRRKKEIKSNLKRERRKNIISYYVGAAIITLLFVNVGFFQSFVDSVPKIVALVEQPLVENGRGFNLDFSKRAVDKAALWIEEFEERK